MKRLLVTGGAGFIGANFCHYWVHTHPADRLVVVDALTYAGNLANIAPLIERGRVQFEHRDILDQERVTELIEEQQLDTVVNFAAESHVDRSIEDPQLFLRTNVMGTQALLDAARTAWGDAATEPSHRFHHVSTDEVYGSLGPDEPSSTERSPYAPNSPYAASKAAADHLVRAYERTYGLQCTISNCSNNYGPFQFPEKLLPLCIVNILEGRTLPIYGDGLQIRDWLHVRDHCRAIDRILSASPPSETWNVGSGAPQEPNLMIVGRLCDLVDAAFAADPDLAGRFPAGPPARKRCSRELIEHVRDRPGHDRRYSVDDEKIRHGLSFRPEMSLAEGLATTVRWYLENDQWWRELRSRQHLASTSFGSKGRRGTIVAARGRR